jgi:hypothetical protein
MTTHSEDQEEYQYKYDCYINAIPLMNKDIDTVDYIVSNGYQIIDESGYCFYEYRRPDLKNMVEVLIDMKNTTSLRYIYEHTSVNALKEYFERHKLFEYVYEHILPY